MKRLSQLTLLSVAVTGLVMTAPARADHVVSALVSTGPAGGSGAVDVDRVVQISADGSRMIFSTRESLTQGDTDSSADIYLHAAGATTLLSTGPAGGNGPFDALARKVSDDGSHVFFETAESLVQADSDSSVDVYERSSGTTGLVSTGSAGGNGAFDARLRAISADGSHVAFDTLEQLDAADADTTRDVYAHSGGTTVLVSKDLPPLETTSPTGDVVLVSENGGRIFFTAGREVWERSGGATARVSVGSQCNPCIGGAKLAGISHDGSKVFFVDARGLTFDDNDFCGEDPNENPIGCEDVYERSAGVTTLVSTGPSANGNVYLNSYLADTSADGSHVFVSTDDFLTPTDTDQGSFDYFERFAGQTRLVSTGPADDGIDFSDPSLLWASRDGTRVFFEMLEQMTFDDTDIHTYDVYDWSAGVTTLATVGTNGQNGTSNANFAGAADDASRMFFTTTDQLSPADTDSTLDVYERISHTLTALLQTGPHPTTVEAVSRDGTSVVVRTADPIIATDTDSAEDLYLFRAPSGYPRPKSATLIWTPLVPAYEPCASANRTHGPPLASGSCAPPQRSATQLTLGTPDANGQPSKSAGSVRVRSVPGNPSPLADEADARIVLDITDVRVATDLSDYTGQLEVRLGLRITDKLGGVAATVQDTTLSVPAQCVETADPEIGGWCSLVTTADALAPGTVVEGKRTIWALDALRVYHAGAPFAVQGLFVP